MAKRIFIIVIFILLLFSACFQCIYLKTAVDEMLSLTKDIRAAAEKKDYAAAYENACTFLDVWNRKRKTFEWLCEHEAIHKIQEAAEHTAGFAYAEVPQIHGEINELQFYLKHVVDMDAFSLENIF